METEKCKREAFVWGNLQNQAQLSISKIFSTGSVYLHWCKCTALSWSSACLNSWLSAVSQRFWPFLKLFFKVFQTNLRHHPHNNSLLIPYKKNLLLLCLALKKKKNIQRGAQQVPAGAPAFSEMHHYLARIEAKHSLVFSDNFVQVQFRAQVYPVSLACLFYCLS